jgi:DNA-binding transcriptional ArsR family regulator
MHKRFRKPQSLDRLDPCGVVRDESKSARRVWQCASFWSPSCSAFLLRGSQLSRAKSSTQVELSSIDMLPVSAIGLRMVAAANLVEVAALVGDTARATMLNALMGGQSLTATELAYCANVSRSTASGHLSKLVAARLLTVIRERRFSYYRIASPLVATMLESIKVVAAIEVPPRRQPRSANDDALRFARSCYDHLAGQVGVAVTDALVAMGHIVLTDEGGEVTSSGGRFLSEFGADLRPRTRRIYCQPCLDWSERRYHLKGLVGARILDRLLELGWLKRVSGSRALQLTSPGRAGLSEIFQIEINNEGVPTGRLYDPRRLTA